MNGRYLEYLLCFVVTTIISVLFMPQIYDIAKNVRAIDDPSENERKIHKKKIPRLGGLAIYVSFLLGYAIFGRFMLERNYSMIIARMESVLIASFLIVLMGIFDDISPVRAWKKFAVQIIAATIVVVRGEFVVTDFDFIIDIHFPKYVDSIFTVLWIVTITNAINFSDGMDGLAGGLSFISLMTMAVIGMLDNNTYSVVVTLVSLLLAGSILGFLPYNFPPAKIFMGDSGAQFIGFMIGVLSVLGYKQAAFTSFLVPVIILAVPIFDTIFAFFRRIIKRIPASVADANHVHHRVLQNTSSAKESLFWMYGLSIAFSISAIVYSFHKGIGLIVFVFTFLLAELFLEYFNIISVRYMPLLSILSKIFPSEKRERRRKERALNTLRHQAEQKKVQAKELQDMREQKSKK